MIRITAVPPCYMKLWWFHNTKIYEVANRELVGVRNVGDFEISIRGEISYIIIADRLCGLAISFWSFY